MLLSTKLQKRQSEIRQQLAVLAAKDAPTEDETRSMQTLDGEYGQNETRFRAALTSESEERTAHSNDFATREGKQFADLLGKFELRQAVQFLDDGSAISGETLEVMQEMRNHNSYAGVPIPLSALETRAGESVAGGVFDPKQTMPVIDKLFPQSVAAAMGIAIINIDHGIQEWPVCTQGASAAWSTTELGDIGAAVEYQTIDRPLRPDHNLGCQMVLSRRVVKQAGASLEQSVRTNMTSVISSALDRAIFLGSGSGGVPLGLIPGQSAYGFTLEDVSAAVTYSKLRSEGTKFLIRSAASNYSDIKLLMRLELWDALDDAIFETGDVTTELDRIVKKFGAVIGTANALAAPSGSPLESTAVMCTTVNGTPPAFCGIFGGIDLVRDNFTKAASGSLILTAILTADVTASRSEQVTILTGLQ